MWKSGITGSTIFNFLMTILIHHALFRFALILAVLGLATQSPSAGIEKGSSDYTIAAEPDWILPMEVDDRAAFQEDQSPDGQCFLVINKQIRVGREVENYTFIAKKIVTREGRENGGNIAIDFDPAYEQLAIHRVQILRGGKLLDRFDRKKVSLRQRQKSLDTRIYDGTKTFVLDLTDIRVGDIINYSFTITGYNPALNHHFYHEFMVASLWPIARLEYRLLFPHERQLYRKNIATEIQPRIESTAEHTDYRWSLKEVAGIVPDPELPLWYEPIPYIQISETRDWQDVCRQILPMYEAHYEPAESVKAQAMEISDRQSTPESQFIEALRLVQDKIRFINIISGAKSYVPTAPALILERRFGDSKDKALLLVVILRALGIEAYPAMVNTYLRDHVTDYHPSPVIFNHVCVQARIAGRSYWVDPAIAGQGGNLASLHQADYGQALVLAPATTGVTSMPSTSNDEPGRVTNNLYDLSAGIGNEVRLTIANTYKGIEADMIRYQLAAVGRKQLEKNFRDFYTRFWPDIKLAGNLEFADDRENNEFIIREYYAIPGYWEEKKADKLMSAYFYPIELNDYFNPPQNLRRQVPLRIDHPVNVAVNSTLILPTETDAPGGELMLTDDAFDFSMHTTCDDKTVNIHYSYRSLRDYIAVDKVDDYARKIDQVQNALGYELQYPYEPSKKTLLKWFK